MFSNFVISNIRTYVPLGMGLLLTWIAAQTHFVLSPHSEATLTGLAVALVSAGYYSLVRLLEHWQPKLGVLLGVPAKPDYGAIVKDALPDLGSVTFTDPASMPSDAGAVDVVLLLLIAIFVLDLLMFFGVHAHR